MENGPGLKMYFLLNMGIFHCYASLPEGTPNDKQRMLPKIVQLYISLAVQSGSIFVLAAFTPPWPCKCQDLLSERLKELNRTVVPLGVVLASNWAGAKGIVRNASEKVIQIYGKFERFSLE